MHTTNASDLDPSGTRAMGYYDATDLPYYYELATQYATSDRFFSSLLARTPPNRMYILGASSYGNIDSGTIPDTAPTIFDRLTDAGVSWKYYYQEGVTIRLKSWHTYKTDSDKVQPIGNYFADLKNGTLPSVAFIERGVGLDEHPQNNIQKGAADMKSEIDAWMNSSAYATSAFILFYDEGGGLYDHVPPITVPAPDDIPPKLQPDSKPGDFTLSGFRVPLVVMSPYVKAHFVSHVPRELTSWMKFIEKRWNLKPLTRRDAWADDMTEMFDFTKVSIPTPPPLPAQPTNGKCDRTLEMSPDHQPGQP
jgi:phospholipase C